MFHVVSRIKLLQVLKESTCIAGAFFLNSHPILADIGKNCYICIGIEAIIADRLWNSLP
jgi:hypothetical protein